MSKTIKRKFLELINKYHSSPKGWYKWLLARKDILEEVNKIPPKEIKEKVYWIVNDLHDFPKCYCGKPCKFLSKEKGYAKHCSPTCAALDPLVQSKSKETNILRYGVDNPAKAELVKQKQEKTNLEKYGNKNFLASEEGKIKSRETIQSKYGVDNVQQNSLIKEKTKNTLRAKYGVNCGYLTKRNYKSSKGEKELFAFVKTLKEDSLHNNREEIFPLELDIYIPSLKLAIEYDGDYWHSLPAMKQRDFVKDNICLTKGIKLIRIKESDWKSNKDKIKEELRGALNG